MKCPCCKSDELEPLFDFGLMPQTGRFRSQATGSLKTNSLAFALCLQCAYVRRVEYEQDIDYSEVSRSTSLQHPNYADMLIEKLHQLGVAKSDLILEVGANDGVFLDSLFKAGFSNLVGVEPSLELSTIARGKGHSIICNYFSQNLVSSFLGEYGTPKLVICRHTLEHVPDPYEFLNSISQVLSDNYSLLLLEVPDGMAIPELLNIYEFWDEHVSYFSLNSLEKLLGRTHIKVLEAIVEPHLATRNLVVWGSLSEVRHGAWEPDYTEADSNTVKAWRECKLRWGRFKQSLASAIEAAEHPLYVIGASHSQTNLVNYLDVGGCIDFFIDDDEKKIGRFPAVVGSNAAVITTDEFERKSTGGTIIDFGFGYTAWVKRLTTHARNKQIAVIDPQEYFEDGED